MSIFDTVREAITHENIDDALALVQTAIGVTCGGFASIYFDNDVPDDWNGYSPWLRSKTLFDYMAAEYVHAEWKSEA